MEGLLDQTGEMSGELSDILDPHPERVHRLRSLAQKIQGEIGAYIRD
jgi:hypothetical protein